MYCTECAGMKLTGGKCMAKCRHGQVPKPEPYIDHGNRKYILHQMRVTMTRANGGRVYAPYP